MNIQWGVLKLILKIMTTEILVHYTVRYTVQVARQTGDFPVTIAI